MKRGREDRGPRLPGGALHVCFWTLHNTAGRMGLPETSPDLKPPVGASGFPLLRVLSNRNGRGLGAWSWGPDVTSLAL